MMLFQFRLDHNNSTTNNNNIILSDESVPLEEILPTGQEEGGGRHAKQQQHLNIKVKKKPVKNVSKILSLPLSLSSVFSMKMYQKY